MDTPTTDDAAVPCLSRRLLLAALGAGSLAAVTACTPDPPHAAPSPGGPSPGRPRTDAPAPTSPLAASTAAPIPTAAAVRLTTTDAVPVGGGIVVGNVLIVQPRAGTFAGYDVRCPHLGAPVTVPRNAVITCTGHGSTFRASDGARLQGIATRGLITIPIQIDGTAINRMP